MRVPLTRRERSFLDTRPPPNSPMLLARWLFHQTNSPMDAPLGLGLMLAPTTTFRRTLPPSTSPRSELFSNRPYGVIVGLNGSTLVRNKKGRRRPGRDKKTSERPKSPEVSDSKHWPPGPSRTAGLPCERNVLWKRLEWSSHPNSMEHPSAGIASTECPQWQTEKWRSFVDRRPSEFTENPPRSMVITPVHQEGFLWCKYCTIAPHSGKK